MRLPGWAEWPVVIALMLLVIFAFVEDWKHTGHEERDVRELALLMDDYPPEPPVTAFDLAPLVLAMRDAYDTADTLFEKHQVDRPSDRLITWAEWVMDAHG